jgi:hypothetical protein
MLAGAPCCWCRPPETRFFVLLLIFASFASQELDGYVAIKDDDPAKQVTLRLHMGIGCGNLTSVHVGGVFKRWEYILAGPPMAQVRDQGIICHHHGILFSFFPSSFLHSFFLFFLFSLFV